MDGDWQLSYGVQRPGGPRTPSELASAGWPTIAAAVPGNVEIALMKVGKLPDLAVGNNIYLLRDWEQYQWWYQRKFATPKRQDKARVELVLEGIDCMGTVFLNGRMLGETRNMFIAHRFDVTDLLAADGVENELTVRLDSAVIAGRQHQPAAVEGAFLGNWESLSVRKAPSMYGWDIAPRIVSAGLWRSVRLESLPATRWSGVYFATLQADPSKGKARVMVDWHFVTEAFDIDRWQVRVSLGRDGKTVHTSSQAVVNPHGRQSFDVSPVALWWPRGYGAQPLYDLVLELLDGDGKVLDTWRQPVGLRTIKLVRSDITTNEKPGEFVFVVNGEKVFIKGSNWVPLDSLHSRDQRQLPAAFEMVVDLNCNMLRCWGGNVYEDHDFFDLCDRNGVMVWQDFALACAIYPQTDAFANEIRIEAEAVVRKLRNHPCLALWAGNNEIDDAYTGWFGFPLDPNTDRLSRHVLPEVIRQYDPLRDFLPSSPYHSPAMIQAGNQSHLKPEDHLWGPRDDFKSRFYTSSPAHFVSETGYHGCPDRKSLEQMMDPAFVWPWQNNEQWLTHAVRPLPSMTSYNYRIPLMAKQTAVLFATVPENLDDFILASQISQAEADKFFIELSRSAKWKRTGILWWNVRDCWPIISDAVVDYYNRPKLAYRYIKRVQSDVCAMCGEPEGGHHPLVVVNDTLAEVKGQVTVRDLDSQKAVFAADFRVSRNGREVVGSIPQSAKPAMWLIEWTVGEQKFQNHYLAGPRPFKLDDYKRWLKSL
ncbi:MAG TPA: glycoside hydrolase family 2 [Kiritimatiellia bacterium]|nr:glycoside hydrolase family 2 [Kiritimatiellia bacterium]HPS06461.1 glycoside hydrolase family 2 [Kiritimatiellia bacterium]